MLTIVSPDPQMMERNSINFFISASHAWSVAAPAPNGKEQEREGQPERVVAGAQVGNDGADKEQREANRAAVPTSARAMATRSPNPPAPLRIPSVVIYDSGTPAPAIAMLTC